VRVVEGDYEWDSVKAASNLRKHGVTFEYAGDALRDPLLREGSDIEHPRRLIALCRSTRDLVLVVVYEPRGWRTRIISARKADRRERKEYETGG
jgi:uncharacterized DUF497 family protein